MAELTYDAVKNMTASEFKKEFKAQKALFKKATYLVAVVDYKLSDKKQTILLPYRKKSDAKADYKALKKDKNAKMSNTVAGELKAGQSPEQVIFEIQKGGGTPDSVGGEIAGYFDALATKLQVKQGKMEAEEADEAETAEKPATKISDTAKPTDKVNEAKPAKPLTKDEKIAKYTAIFEALKKSYIEIQNLKAAFKKATDKKTKEPIATELLKKATAWVKSYEAQKNDIPTNDKLEEAYAGLLDFLGIEPNPIPDLAPADPTQEPTKKAPTDKEILEAAQIAINNGQKFLAAMNKEGKNQGASFKLTQDQVLSFVRSKPDGSFVRFIAKKFIQQVYGDSFLSNPKTMAGTIKSLKLEEIAKKYGLE